MVLQKLSFLVASVMLLTTVAFTSGAVSVQAAAKVDCDAVVSELNSGKHERDVAKDLNTTLYQVRRCKRRARAATKAETKSIEGKSRKEMPIPSSAMSAPSAATEAPSAAASP